MQITQTVSEDLRRQYTVTVPASELDSRVTKRLEEMKPRVNLKGFRPGKAPVSFLKKQFGKSVMGEVVEQAVNEGSQKAITDNQLKPALQPRVEPVGDVQQVVDGKADLHIHRHRRSDAGFRDHRCLQAHGRAPDRRRHRRRCGRGAGPSGQAEPQLYHPRRRRSGREGRYRR